MAQLIKAPTRIEAQGTPPKTIEEFIGRVSSGTAAVSIARMVSPSGWSEPAQIPEFDEFTVVLRGSLTVETDTGTHEVAAGQGIIVSRKERGALPNAWPGRGRIHRGVFAGVFSRNCASRK